MLPLIAIGGAIGAVVSAVQGASWLSGHVNASGTAASAGAKSGVTSQADAGPASFEAALAAKTAGQTVPGNATGATAPNGVTPSTIAPPIHGTDYDTIARMKAGFAAYGHIGERHGSHSRSPGASGSEDKPVTRA
jgi:hypothetical protein